MNPELLSAIDRLRQKFFVKATESVGLAGVTIIKAEPQVTDTERVIEIVATTNHVDLDNEVVDPAGIDWSYFNAAGQKKVFVDHNYDTDHCVGVARSISPYMEGGRQTGWKMRIHVFAGKKNHLADDVWTMTQQGLMGASIGFIPSVIGTPDASEKKAYPGADTIVRKCRALELSFTALPCNVKCQALGMDTPKKTIQLTPTQIVV